MHLMYLSTLYLNDRGKLVFWWCAFSCIYRNLGSFSLTAVNQDNEIKISI